MDAMKEHEHTQREIEQLLVEVPKKLQEHPHFVMWRYIEIDGKIKKPPFSPCTGQFASPTDSNTWGTFQQALTTLRSGKFTGIGFVFAESDPFVGIDLDHVLGEDISPQAKEIVTLLNSYTELSPSKTGLHILVQGSLSEGGRRKENTEVYDRGRYFTITGNHLDGTPHAILPRQEALETLYTSLATQETTQAKEMRQGVHYSLLPTRRDEEVLEKARNAKNGASFTSLYRGNIGGYTSKSEADFELVLRLLYWTNDDAEQVQRLFRRSGLYDDKTDRATNGITYLEVTIANALKKRQKR